MKEKLIIFDLDDTLLDENGEVGELTLKVLGEVRAQGHKIVFNTARSQMRSERIFEIVKPDFAIYNGGAHITDGEGNAVFESGIDKETCNALVPEFLTVTERFSMQADWFYTANPDYKAPDVKYFDFKANEFPMGAYKIIAHSHEPEKFLPIAEKYDLDFSTYFGGPFCRFTKKGITKASGNRELVRQLGLELADVIAFGDDTGDFEMILEAGVGVLMKNAKDALLLEAKEKNVKISAFSNAEEGVAKFLAEYFSININQ
jgi:Cof subfamily protein (haloacid dehalogenase superfamily)